MGSKKYCIPLRQNNFFYQLRYVFTSLQKKPPAGPEKFQDENTPPPCSHSQQLKHRKWGPAKSANPRLFNDVIKLVLCFHCLSSQRFSKLEFNHKFLMKQSYAQLHTRFLIINWNRHKNAFLHKTYILHLVFFNTLPLEKNRISDNCQL